jgi:hypothetical protein
MAFVAPQVGSQRRLRPRNATVPGEHWRTRTLFIRICPSRTVHLALARERKEFLAKKMAAWLLARKGADGGNTLRASRVCWLTLTPRRCVVARAGGLTPGECGDS